MISRVVKLSDVKEAETFNKLCELLECASELSQDSYCVDAKSIMGIFSLDLRSELRFTVHTDDGEKIDSLFRKYYI